MNLLRRWLKMVKADIALFGGLRCAGRSQATGGLVGIPQMRYGTIRCSKNAGSSTSNEAERYRREKRSLFPG